MSHRADFVRTTTRIRKKVEQVEEKPDMVNSPPHYTAGKIEPIEFIEAWDLGFCEGNAVKYIARAKHKGNELEDLKKAQWYIARRIKQLEEAKFYCEGR